MSLFAELKRRNVLRVTLAYLAASWLLIQVIETLFPIFGLSAELIRWFVILLVLGLPITLMVSWFYEITPQGVMSTDDADAAGYSRPATFGRQIDFVIIGMLVIAVGWLVYEREGGPGIIDNSIAVLPFTNHSPDPEQTWFSDGVADEILNVLAREQGLRVTARTSSFQFRGQNLDVQTIGQRLNVAAVLEGAVRRSENELRINVQLIGTKDGFQLWSSSYERTPDDVFAVQDEIAAAIVSELRTHLGIDPATDLDGRRISTVTEAYDLYLQGLYHQERLFAPGQENTNEDAPAAALAFFERAIEADDGFALAYIGRARALGNMAGMAQMSWDVAAAKIKQDVQKALALGPNLAEVQLARAEADFLFDRDRESKLTHVDRAIDLNPNFSRAYAERSNLLVGMGRYRDAFAAADIAAQIDPLNGDAVEKAMYARFYQGETDDIEERLLAASRLWPDANGLVMEAHVSFELGHLERIAAYQRRADVIPGFGVEAGNWVASAPRHFGDTYLTLGMTDMARQWMMNPDMAGRYDDAILMSEGRYDEAIEFLRDEFENGKDKQLYAYRWHPDIIASLVEAYLYAGRYAELAAFLDGLSWRSGLFPLPNSPLTNPPWPEVAYVFAMFETGRNEQADEWLGHLVEQLEHRLAEGIEVPNHYYELARLRVMQDRVPEAFDALEKAFDLGWRRWYLDLDPILEPVRSMPGFAALKGRHADHIARARAEVSDALIVAEPARAN